MSDAGSEQATAAGTAGELYFGVDARHVRQLGRELVGDRVTALVELVKNAYDADATEVDLRFRTDSVFELKSGSTKSAAFGIGTVWSGEIVVKDDGVGMSFDDLSHGWMRIAGDTKERTPKSALYQRARSGRKGIGRFAAESLGEHLTLWTTTQGSAEGVLVKFDWQHDYDAGQDLQLVGNRYEVLEAPIEEHGTTLTIRGLHGSWTTAQRARVSRALLLLQPPFPLLPVASRATSDDDDDHSGVLDDPGFRVTFAVNGAPEKSNSIEGFLEGETAHIEVEVSAEGHLRLRVHSAILGLDRTEELDRGFPTVGKYQLRASYFIYSRDTIGVPLQVARELAADFGGIRIYRDGMRLLPYGESSNDWLGLDARSRRREYLNPIGNQNFFAQVIITRAENPLLVDTSSREGLINNEAYEELTGSVTLALLTATTWVAEHRQRRGKGGASTSPPKPTRAQIVATAAESVKAAFREQLPSGAARSAAAIVDAALDIVVEQASSSDDAERAEIQRLQGEIELLRVLASLGTSISVFSHEVRAVINAASATVGELGRSERLSAGEQKTLAIANESLASLRDISKYIDSFTGGASERSRVPQAMAHVLSDFAERFGRPLARDAEVEFEVVPDALRTAPMGNTALQAILINLFTNAVKAIDPEDSPVRKIRISARSSNDQRQVLLWMSDTGTGVPETLRDRMFDAFVTSRRATDLELGVGTGLGLKVVADLAHEYGGSADLIEPENGYVTTIQVTLPRWEEQWN